MSLEVKLQPGYPGCDEWHNYLEGSALLADGEVVYRTGGLAHFAGEFKIRLPREKKRYLQSAGGGAVMGYGAGIAMGCTIGAFFSAIPSLAVNGWVFALFLAIGAWLGVQIIQRIQ